MKREHRKKMIAPIIVTIITLLYYAVFFGWLIHDFEGTAGILLGIVPLILAGIMIYVCIQRIKEIKEGEEDDLSKY